MEKPFCQVVYWKAILSALRVQTEAILGVGLRVQTEAILGVWEEILDVGLRVRAGVLSALDKSNRTFFQRQSIWPKFKFLLR